MAIAPRQPLIVPWALCAGLMLAGCAATPVQKPAQKPAIATTSVALDWRRLPILPFGSPLQDLQVPVHEVLMFGELAGQECYALDEPSQRFPGREVESYLLCFARGRLDRVELTLSLPYADAAAEFSRYCDQWQIGTAEVSARNAERCDGSLPQGPSFSAALGQPPGQPPDNSPGDSAVPLLIIVSDTPVPGRP
jgi:hypothetical protein